jgi:hypothetical protein
MNDTDRIAPDSPLGRALNAGGAPDLPVDFADRIIARTKDRPAPLPEPRRSGGGVQRWRSARRLGIGLAVTGALATAAAAATGLIDLPSPQQVWSAITGQEAEPTLPAQPNLSDKVAEPKPVSGVPKTGTVIDGPIDTPEELEEAFRRVDEAREDRRAQRRDNVDRRIDEALARRRAQGLPAPTPEEEAQMRARLEQARERGDAKAEQRIEQRREQLREKVEAGDAITAEDLRPDPARRERFEELRNLSPAERRARLRELRQQRLQQAAPPTSAPTPAPTTSSPEN